LARARPGPAAEARMKANILSVGGELVAGQTVDTNSAYLARRLGERGIEAAEHCTVGDDLAEIIAAISRLARDADVLIITGGLGPTEDDLTRRALADATGSQLLLNERRLAVLEEFFRSRGRQMAENNRRQAMIPAGAEPLENPVGTACGIAARLGRCRIFAVPGVPREMRQMFADQVAPRLPHCPRVILHRWIHTFGLGESDVGAKIADLMALRSGSKVGTVVEAGVVSVRITVNAADRTEVERRAGRLTDEIKRRLGSLVFGQDGETMASAVGSLLRDRRATLAAAESCTGGMLGEMITGVPGSSDYFLGGIVAYADQAKLALLAVPGRLLATRGAVSEQVAAAMATGCRRRFESDYALSVTGIAGPGGGSEEKPVGLVFTGLARPDGIEVQRHLLTGDRQVVRTRAALSALNSLRLRLMGS